MTFQIVPMLAGDLYDAANRFAGDTLGAMSASNADTSAVRAEAWKQAVQMGWPAVLIAEANGGAGGSLADIAAIVEAMAGSGLGLPVIERGAVVPSMLESAGTPEATAWLGKIAAGEADFALVLDPATSHLDLTVGATHCLVALPRQRLLVAVEAKALPVVRRYRSVDGRTMADVATDRVPTDASVVVARGEAFDRAWTDARNIGALLVCAETVGAQGALVALTIDYLVTRKQFGHALSTFQVLRHRVVDMYVSYECTKGLVGRTLADAVERGGVQTRDASLVKAYVSKSGRGSAEAAIQLHGGMGMTEELLVARLAERVLSSEFDHGDRYVHLRRIADDRRGASSGASARAAEQLSA